MSAVSREAEKWRLLRLGAQWDRCAVPIYETAARGRGVLLLKTLLTSYCKNDCKYCALRCGRKYPRQTWNPLKLARMTTHLFQVGKIEGIFLSSSVLKDPDYTVEKELEVARFLRRMGYVGYIHLRLMPGTSRDLVKEAVRLADRVGVNLEAPSNDIFSELCPSKGEFYGDVIKRLEWIVEEAQRLERKDVDWGFTGAGVDTQLIVGAVHDSDRRYLQVTEWLYRRLGLRRVYYSGFEPIPHTPLENQRPCSASREYRLYQASFLIRDYGFTLDDLSSILTDEGFLPNVDPKYAFAKVNPHLFPIDLNVADRIEILRVPGVGPVTAESILKARSKSKIRYLSDLEKILGPSLARNVAPYVELKEKRLTELLV